MGLKGQTVGLLRVLVSWEGPHVRKNFLCITYTILLFRGWTIDDLTTWGYTTRRVADADERCPLVITATAAMYILDVFGTPSLVVSSRVISTSSWTWTASVRNDTESVTSSDTLLPVVTHSFLWMPSFQNAALIFYSISSIGKSWQIRVSNTKLLLASMDVLYPTGWLKKRFFWNDIKTMLFLV